MYQAHVSHSALRKAFAKSLASFIAFLSHGAIDGEVTRDTSLDVAALQLEAVLDLPTVNTRAGLYILFNALVSFAAKTLF
jgi:mediator of RNA polymerase II transcription subunit 5